MRGLPLAPPPFLLSLSLRTVKRGRSHARDPRLPPSLFCRATSLPLASFLISLFALPSSNASCLTPPHSSRRRPLSSLHTTSRAHLHPTGLACSSSPIRCRSLHHCPWYLHNSETFPQILKSGWPRDTFHHFDPSASLAWALPAPLPLSSVPLSPCLLRHLFELRTFLEGRGILPRLRPWRSAVPSSLCPPGASTSTRIRFEESAHQNHQLLAYCETIRCCAKAAGP